MIQYAVIAAGAGARLAEAGVPKPLVCLGGRPLIARIMENFAAAGARSAVVTVRPENQPLIVFLRETSLPVSVEIVAVAAATPLQSLGAALDALSDGRCIVATVDSVVNPQSFIDFAAKYASLPATDALLAVSAVSQDVARSGLYVTADASGRVGGLTDTPAAEPAWISAGIYAFDVAAGRRALRMAEESNCTRLRDFQRRLLQLCPAHIFDIGVSADVDTPADLANARKIFEE